MDSNIYATVGDTVQFAPHPKGGEIHKGEKGNWKTIEGTIVVSGISCRDAEDFAVKARAMITLWPGCVVRFTQEQQEKSRPQV